jgi:hypothetical protein
MRLKGRSSIELAKIFAGGSCPKATSLLGPEGVLSEWRVDMLTGPIPTMGGWPFRHRKQFYPSLAAPAKVTGCNVVFNNLRWGWFHLDDNTAFDGIDRRGVLFVDYDLPENGCLAQKIIDRLRTIDKPNVLLGEFSYNMAGRSLGPYYFSLTRIATDG